MSKIEEEHDELCSMSEKKNPSKISNPIHIGHHVTLSGHEAMNLAKRLSEELATQNQTVQAGSHESTVLNLPRASSPEPISRSFEGKKGNLMKEFDGHSECKFYVFYNEMRVNNFPLVNSSHIIVLTSYLTQVFYFRACLVFLLTSKFNDFSFTRKKK